MNEGELSEHGDTIPKKPHLRSRLIGPIHRNFCDPIAALLSDEQQFEVKPVAVDGRYGKEIACHGSFEQLKPALCVADPLNASHSNDGVETAAQDAPVPAGIDCELPLLGGQTARSDRQVGSVPDGLLKPVELRNGCCAIGIGEELQPAPCGEHPLPDRSAFPHADRQGNQPQRRFLFREPADHFERVILAAVIDDNDFVGSMLPGEMVADRVQMGENTGCFVVRRDNDGEIQYSVEFFLRHRIFPSRVLRGSTLEVTPR